MSATCCGKTFASVNARAAHQSHHAGIRASKPDDPARVMAKVRQTSGCWEWMASLTPSGYGQVWWRGRLVNAHRVVFEIVRGPIAEGMQLDHLCRNRRCVNPDHLEPVTQSENLRRGERASRTHCPAGHEYDRRNTATYARSATHHGGRQCRQCRAESKRVREGAVAA